MRKLLHNSLPRTGEKKEKKMKLLQLCPTVCDPMDFSLPGFSIHGVFQGIPDCVVISFSRGSSQPRDQTEISALQADT